MLVEDLTYEEVDNDINEGALTFKKAMMEPGKKVEELTMCIRVYSFGYNSDGYYGSYLLEDGDPRIIDTNGYTEPRTKRLFSWNMDPKDTPFDIAAFLFASRDIIETKNEWSFFRKSKGDFNANEWHNYCIVYSVPKRNTGIVFNGEILANRNQTELWANEDNFYTSHFFEPWHKVTQDDGNEYDR